MPANVPVVLIPGDLGTFPVGISSSNPDVVQAALHEFDIHEGPKPATLTSTFNIDVTINGKQFQQTSPYIATVQAFEAAGYVLNKDLFVDAWDWRLPIAPEDGVDDGKLTNLTADLMVNGRYQYGVSYLGTTMLKAEDAWTTNNPGQPFPGVNLIAHSLGNIVAKSYIQSAAYAVTATTPDGRTVMLPHVINYAMMAGPNQGQPPAFVRYANNFLGTGNAAASFLSVELPGILNPAFEYVADGGTITVDGAPTISAATVTNPATGQLDAEMFLQQYLGDARQEIATSNFLDGGNVNGSDVFSNGLLLDLNGGPDINGFAAFKNVFDFYGNSVPTPATVSTMFGPGGEILPISLTVTTPQPTQDGQVWYQNNFEANGGDGEVAITSSAPPYFNGDARIQLYPVGGGVTHNGIMESPGVLSTVIDLFATHGPPISYVAVGAGAGGGPRVNVYDAVTGEQAFEFFAFDPSFTGGVAVAVADVTRDNVPDIIVGAGAGGGPNVKVFDGTTGALVYSFMAFAPTFTGGVSVGAADVNGDGYADIVVGAGPGGGPNVKVFDGNGAGLLASFFAFAPTFTGGVAVAGGDVTGDGYDDIVVGARPGGGPNVRVFDGTTLALVSSVMAFDPTFAGGVWVSAGDVNGDGYADIIVGAGPGGGPEVRVFDGQDFAALFDFFAYDTTFRGGVRVASVIADPTGRANVVTGAGPGSGGGPVRVYNPTLMEDLDDFSPFPGFTGGVFVGGG